MEEVCQKALERCQKFQVIKLVKSKGFCFEKKASKEWKIGEEEHVRYNRFSCIILEKIVVDQRIRVIIGSQG